MPSLSSSVIICSTPKSEPYNSPVMLRAASGASKRRFIDARCDHEKLAARGGRKTPRDEHELPRTKSPWDEKTWQTGQSVSLRLPVTGAAAAAGVAGPTAAAR